MNYKNLSAIGLVAMATTVGCAENSSEQNEKNAQIARQETANAINKMVENLNLGEVLAEPVTADNVSEMCGGGLIKCFIPMKAVDDPNRPSPLLDVECREVSLRETKCWVDGITFTNSGRGK